MKKERIKNLCTMCTTKIYTNGEKFDISSGGVMLRGGFQKEAANTHRHDLDILSIAAGETPKKLSESQDMKILTLKKVDSVSKKKSNLSQIMQTKILEEKKFLDNLGKKAKNILNESQIEIESEFHGIRFINPKQI